MIQFYRQIQKFKTNIIQSLMFENFQIHLVDDVDQNFKLQELLPKRNTR